MSEAARGHRSLPHTADIRLQAWAPTREDCLAEAVAGLVDSFADTTGVAPQWSVDTEIRASSDEEALVAALNEVIYLLETQGGVPVHAEAAPIEDGLRLRLDLVPVAAVPQCGATPKAVTLHELRFGRCDGGWACEVTVDV
jgi:SHS2 domain-containing protein